jgi:hypothetical protein
MTNPSDTGSGTRLLRAPNGNGGSRNFTTSATGAHSHPIDATDSYGNTTPFSILPPYYAMIYIIKVA